MDESVLFSRRSWHPSCALVSEGLGSRNLCSRPHYWSAILAPKLKRISRCGKRLSRHRLCY